MTMTPKEHGRFIRQHAQQRRWREDAQASRMMELDRVLREKADQISAELAEYPDDVLISELKRRGLHLRRIKSKNPA